MLNACNTDVHRDKLYNTNNDVKEPQNANNSSEVNKLNWQYTNDGDNN